MVLSHYYVVCCHLYLFLLLCWNVRRIPPILLMSTGSLPPPPAPPPQPQPPPPPAFAIPLPPMHSYYLPTSSPHNWIPIASSYIGHATASPLSPSVRIRKSLYSNSHWLTLKVSVFFYSNLLILPEPIVAPAKNSPTDAEKRTSNP